MSNFKKYCHANGKEKTVKIGFSFTAFLFPILWALYNRLWEWVIICFVVYFITGSILSASVQSAVNTVIQGADNTGQHRSAVFFAVALWLAAQVGIRVYLGISGNKFKEQKLIQRGFFLKS